MNKAKKIQALAGTLAGALILACTTILDINQTIINNKNESKMGNARTKIETMEVKGATEVKGNTELIKRKEVKNTPFTIISKTDTNEHFAVMGDYRITEVYDSQNKVEKEVKKITWNRIVQVMMILNEKVKEDAKSEK